MRKTREWGITRVGSSALLVLLFLLYNKTIERIVTLFSLCLYSAHDCFHHDHPVYNHLSEKSLFPKSLQVSLYTVLICAHYSYTSAEFPTIIPTVGYNIFQHWSLTAHLLLSCCLASAITVLSSRFDWPPHSSDTWSRPGSVSSLLARSHISSLTCLPTSSFACLCVHRSACSLAHLLHCLCAHSTRL